MVFKLARKSREEDVKKLRDEVVKLIDESSEVTYKIVFYSLNEVQEIMNKLIDRWEKNGMRERPIDYATPEEVKILYKIARKITSRPPSELVIEYKELFTGY